MGMEIGESLSIPLLLRKKKRRSRLLVLGEGKGELGTSTRGELGQGLPAGHVSLFTYCVNLIMKFLDRLTY